ncbi:MAG: dTDP-4-dehydrorhamnose reductase [Clostridiales bacterium]
MKILISGNKGQLGREITKQTNSDEYSITGADIDELDITDFNATDLFVSNIKPDVIINCSAYTNVDACEDNESLAFKVNASGARNLSLCAKKIGAKIVHISTDYVFDGNATKPLKEYDNISPINKYGESKEYGERLVRETNEKHFILRTSWLYGDGNNFVKTMLKLSETRDNLDVVDDQVGSPTSTVDLAKCILELVSTELYGTYHATNEGVCSWYDFAKKIFELKGIDMMVNRVNSEQFKRKAKRPAYSVLENFMLNVEGKNCFRHWEESLEEYLKNL